jgi:autotransporter-associated beta strand protein
MGDPQNLPIGTTDVTDFIFNGTFGGGGNINVLSNGQDNNPDGGNGFRIRGLNASTYSGTITVGNNVKFEIQTSQGNDVGPFSPIGTGKIVMTGGVANLNNTLPAPNGTTGYSEINIRNNSTGDATFGNDIAVTGTGLIILNPLGTAPVGTKITMGNLSAGAGQEVGVYLGAEPSHVLEFKTVTLSGTPTVSPKTPGFGATTSAGSDLLFGNISETVPSSGLIMNGLRTLTLAGTSNTYTGPTTVNNGRFVVTGSIASSSGVTVNGGTYEVPVTQRVKTLTINNGGTTLITPDAPAKVLVVGDNTSQSPLTIDTAAGGTANLQINGNGLAIDFAPGGETAATTATRNQVRAGLGSGDWLGNGITSSLSAASPSSTGVGYGLASDLIAAAGGDFMGQNVDGSTVIARHTLLGDANLDLTVDFNDLARLAQNYNVADGQRIWSQGDFTYDGNVDFNDLAKMAQNYNTSLPAPAELAVLGGGAAFSEDVARAFAQVPEPGAMSLLTIVAAGVLSRRRRSQ